MRDVEWVEEGAVGARDEPAHGSLAELLVGGPYPMLSPPEIPPLSVINEELSQGRGGGGMNGGRRWHAFAISESEYDELRVHLSADLGFERTTTPAWVVRREDWHAWILERRRGVPAEVQLRLNATATQLTDALERAQADPTTPPARQAELYLEADRARYLASQFSAPWTTSASHSNYRRAMGWLGDARRRMKAAEIAGDRSGIEACEREIAALSQRLKPWSNDDWPREWEEWPDFPPPEPTV